MKQSCEPARHPAPGSLVAWEGAAAAVGRAEWSVPIPADLHKIAAARNEWHYPEEKTAETVERLRPFRQEAAMQIFIDESGDCGMKGRRSADYFAVAGVILRSPEEVAACEGCIQGVRKGLRLPPDFEFHFGKIKDSHRRSFLTMMAKCDFVFRVCLLDKTVLSGSQWLDKAYFYEKILGALVDDATPLLKEAQAAKGKSPLKGRATFDDNEDPIYLKVLREQFRRPKSESGQPLIVKVRPGRSKSSDLIQLADMLCGAAVRWHTGDASYLELVAKLGQVRRLFEKN